MHPDNTEDADSRPLGQANAQTKDTYTQSNAQSSTSSRGMHAPTLYLALDTGNVVTCREEHRIAEHLVLSYLQGSKPNLFALLLYRYARTSGIPGTLHLPR